MLVTPQSAIDIVDMRENARNAVLPRPMNTPFEMERDLRAMRRTERETEGPAVNEQNKGATGAIPKQSLERQMEMRTSRNRNATVPNNATYTVKSDEGVGQLSQGAERNDRQPKTGTQLPQSDGQSHQYSKEVYEAIEQRKRWRDNTWQHPVRRNENAQQGQIHRPRLNATQPIPRAHMKFGNVEHVSDNRREGHASTKALTDEIDRLKKAYELLIEYVQQQCVSAGDPVVEKGSNQNANYRARAQANTEGQWSTPLQGNREKNGLSKKIVPDALSRAVEGIQITSLANTSDNEYITLRGAIRNSPGNYFDLRVDCDVILNIKTC